MSDAGNGTGFVGRASLPINSYRALMTPNLDIYRSAKLLIDQHGEGAARHAAMRANAFLKAGDMEGRRVWLRVIRAANVLLDLQRPPSTAVH